MKALKIAKTYSATQWGINGLVVSVEASGSRSTKQILITGLAGECVRESRERIRACLGGMGFQIPKRKVVVHLSPANCKKQGSQFDLAIALTILSAEGLLSGQPLAKLGVLGELNLDGRVRRVPAILGLVQSLLAHGCQYVFVPEENALEASLIKNPKVRVISHVKDVLSYVREARLPEPATWSKPLLLPPETQSLDQVQGQALAKRALQISLAGKHHLLMLGSPGVGKSMLAKCAPDLLPALSDEELADVMKCQDQIPKSQLAVRSRPFRSPHHSISYSALLGGGSGVVHPGEISLANQGVLFLDEFPEFRRDAIEGLREPLENGVVYLHRVGQSLELPANFLLIAAMNPCPCGRSLSKKQNCWCSREQLSRYRKKISGPILDRIDLGVVMDGIEESNAKISHSSVKKSISRVWETQLRRKKSERSVWLRLHPSDQKWLDGLINRTHLGLRVRDKILEVARTIADLDESKGIEHEHLIEAWRLRCPDLASLHF